MNDEKFSFDDPRLTAFALGELEGEQHEAVAATVARDPELQRFVADVRATAMQLEAALAAEPVESTASPAPVIAARPRRGVLLRFPTAYYAIAGMAAAGFAIVVVVREQVAKQPGQIQNITMTPPAPNPVADTRIAESNNVRPPASEASVDVAELAVALVAPRPELAPITTPEVRLAPTIIPPPEFTELASIPDFVAPPAPAPSGVMPRSAGPSPANPGSSLAKAKSDGEPAAKSGGARQVASAGTVAERKRDASRLLPDTVTPLVITSGRAGSESRAADPRAAADLAEGGVVTLEPFVVSTEREGSAAALAMNRFSMNVRSVSSDDALPRGDVGAERYGYRRDNAFVSVGTEPLSSFSVEADTGSYASVRRHLRAGELPPRDAVRIEELVNYFPFRYDAPSGDMPFAATLEVAEAPWEPKHRLVRIGLKGREISAASRPAANLVFLIDISGSMDDPQRLPLVKHALRVLVTRLRPEDRVAIVTYAGHGGLALASTPVARSREIMTSIDELSAAGSTNGSASIQLAYDIAKANFITEGVNRVIVCTDGDFNMGITNDGELLRFVEEKAATSVFLTVLGFGIADNQNAKLELLAHRGGGNYGYIDTRREAEKTLAEQLGGTLMTIARDVKVQVEFNPWQVSAYRLLGYENRQLRKDEFDDDKVEAGEIGAGHTITALYEIVPARPGARPASLSSASPDNLKYQRREVMRPGLAWAGAEDPLPSKELLNVKVRYKKPLGLGVSHKLDFALTNGGTKFSDASTDFRFAAAVAGFGLALRADVVRKDALARAWQWASASLGDDAGGYRAEFVELAKLAERLAE